MGIKFQDYYATLGVARTATPEEIQRAYRKLAREYHPDVNKAPEAAAKFKQAAEAYEVLKDPKRKERYDRLGADYKPGEEFRAPPGWHGRTARGNGNQVHVNFGDGESMDAGAFSDFFDAFFAGSAGGAASGMGGDPFAEMRGATGGRGQRSHRPRAGADQEATIAISLREAFSGVTRRVNLVGKDKAFDVKVPAGITDGATIRLAGQGEQGQRGGPAGDLLLRVRVEPDERFRVEGHDLVTVLPVSPWEAALGAKVSMETLDSSVTLTIPPGSSSGQRLRLRGRGLPSRSDGPGDLLVELRLVVPKTLSDAEREGFERLRSESRFDPRSP